MTALRLIPLPIHSALEMLVGLALGAAPFALGLSTAAIFVGVIAGALIVGLALQGVDATVHIGAHHAADRGVALGLAAAGAVMAAGGDGVISVVSNATPRSMARLVECAAAGQLAEARELHVRLLAWMRAAFIESNPIPVKAALAMLGRIENVVRLPLVPLADQHAGALRSALEAAGALA